MSGPSPADALKEALPDAVEEVVADGTHPFVRVKAESIVEAARVLKENCGVEMLHQVSGVDFASLVMRSKLNPIKWMAASILVATVTVGSALYPAWRASRLAPSEAMRFFG